MPKSKPTVGSFLFDYLHQKGVGHIFGIPGDFALPTFRWLDASPLKLITTTHEPSVGFAADAYARQTGLGVALITYCVGGLNMLNAVACAYAEKSPLLVLSGGPSHRERRNDYMIHHKVRNFDTQRRIYEEVTCANSVLFDAATAADEIMRVVETVMEQSRPGYIEIPYDLPSQPISLPTPRPRLPALSDAATLAAGVADAVTYINNAKRPVIIAGVELHRHRMTEKAVALAEKFQIPIATDILSKSAICENNPYYIGVFSGSLSDPKTKAYVDESDCIIMLGAFATDVFFGFIPNDLDRSNTILVTTEKCRVGYRSFDQVQMGDFMDALLQAPVTPRHDFINPNPPMPLPELSSEEAHGDLTVPRFYNILSRHIGENDTIVADVGDALFGAVELRTRQRSHFVADAFYLSMGFAMPAALGVAAAQRDMGEKGTLFAIIGDGAFQMTGIEFSTAVKCGMKPIVIVMNNDGYRTQRFIVEGDFNNLQPWNYHQLPEMIGGGRGYLARTPAEFDTALKQAIASGEAALIEAVIPKDSASNALMHLGKGLASQRNAKQKASE